MFDVIILIDRGRLVKLFIVYAYVNYFSAPFDERTDFADIDAALMSAVTTKLSYQCRIPP